MKENVISALIIIGVLGIVGALWFAYENPALNPRLKNESYVIIRKWDLPNELSEISGIQYLDEDKMACVQDEEGIIYIYNLFTDTIDLKINFAKSADYESLAIVDSTAYVLESNGKIHIIENYNSAFTTEEVNTFFTSKSDIETLAPDKKNNRLLLMAKEKDPNFQDHKGIYAFDLENKQVSRKPILKIPLEDSIFEDKNHRNKKPRGFFPSDMAINPVDGNYYILEGKNPQLLIISPEGKLLRLHTLNRKSFRQPEGITFSPEGTLYISNEGKKGMANILEVELKELP